MQHFPIFMAVKGRRIVVSGGGDAAVAKLRLLLKTAIVKVFGGLRFLLRERDGRGDEQAERETNNATHVITPVPGVMRFVLQRAIMYNGAIQVNETIQY